MPQGIDLHERFGPMPLPPLLWLRSKQLLGPIAAFVVCVVTLLLAIALTL